MYRLLEKRAKLEAEGKDLSQMDEEIGISSLQLMDDWKKSGDELIDKHRLNNVSSFEGTDPRSIRRKLDRRILLMVKQLFQPGQNLVSPWILPQRRNNGEPLIEARITNNVCIFKYIFYRQLNSVYVRRSKEMRKSGCLETRHTTGWLIGFPSRLRKS